MSQERETQDPQEDDSKNLPHKKNFDSNAHANAARATRSKGDSTDFISPAQLSDMIEGSERLTADADEKLLQRLKSNDRIKANTPKGK